MRRWPVKKPIPNICPSCEGPLNHAQCVAKNCERAQLCEHCGRLLTVYGVCTNRLCLMAVCDICHVYLDVYGLCPNSTCLNSMRPKVAGLSARAADDPMFTSPTDKPDAPQITVCETCGNPYEAVLASCPHCTERLSSKIDDPFDADPVAGSDVNQRLTIPCPDPAAFDVAPLRIIDVDLPKDPKPPFVRKSSRPHIEITIQDADADEEEILARETQKLLQGEDESL